MQRTHMRTLAGIALLGGGLTAGFVLGKSMSRELPPPAPIHVTTPIAAPESSRGDQTVSAAGSVSLSRFVEGKSDFQRRLQLAEYVAGLDAGAMHEAVNEALHLPLEYRDDALAVIFARWSELDPAAAVKYVQLLPRTSELGRLRHAAVVAWAEQDAAAAIEWAKAADSNDVRDEALAAALSAIARRDPRAAVQAALANVTGRQSGTLISELFKTWADTDLNAALAAAREIGKADLRMSAIQGALRRQIDIEPRRALEAVKEFNLGEQNFELVWPAFERWMERDGDAARAFFAGLPPGPMRENSLYVVATAMARSRPQEALAWASGLSDAQERRMAIVRLFEVWPSKDSADAFAAAKALTDPELRSAVYFARLDRISDEDLPMAISAIGELPASDQKAAYGKLVGRWSRFDPKGATEWVVKNASQVDPANLTAAVSAWFRAAPEAAREWVMALPQGDARSEALGVLIGQLSQKDPAAAAAELERVSGEAQQKAAFAIARSFASKAPDQAARWAGSIRDPQVQAIAMAEVARSWAQRNPTEAAAWLDGLTPGAGKDSAISNFSRSVLQRDPEGALSWAASMSNAENRNQLMCSLVAEWLAFDRKSSTAWLQNAQLDPQLRTRIVIIDEYLQGSRRPVGGPVGR